MPFCCLTCWSKSISSMPGMSEIIWENGGSRRKLFLSRKYLRETGVRRLLKYRKQTLEKRLLCSKLRSWRLKLNLSVKTRLRNEERKMFQETTENNTIHINNHGKLMKVEWAPTVTGSQEVEITKIMTTSSNDWWEERKSRQFFSKSDGLV